MKKHLKKSTKYIILFYILVAAFTLLLAHTTPKDTTPKSERVWKVIK